MSSSEDGASWATAFTTLESGLAAAAGVASSGISVEVWVTEGVYTTAAMGAGRASTFDLPAGVSVRGGFAGGEAAAEDRLPGSTTTLSGDIGDVGDPADNTFTVLTFAPAAGASPSGLERLTLRGGVADGAGTDGEGGGLFQSGGTLLIEQGEFVDNFAERGGGLFSRNGTLEVSDSRFAGNRGESEGGGVYSQSAMTVRSTRFDSNSSVFGGGLLHCCDQATLRGVAFSRNTATRGGGLYVPIGNVTLIDIQAFDNSATNGGFTMIEGTAEFIGLRAGGNTASLGGAIYASGATSLTNASIVSNLALQNGGGVFVAAPDIMVSNSTIVENEAFVFGGGVYVGFGSGPAASTILARNASGSASGEGEQFSASGLASITADRCVIEGFTGAIPGAGSVPGIPSFEDPFGPDGLLGTADDDLSLLKTDPGVDFVEVSELALDLFDLDGDGVTSEALPFDVRAAQRVFDDPLVPNLAGAMLDVGAFEAVRACVSDIDQSGSVGLGDLLYVLANFSSGDPVGDLDGSGVVDLADLLVVLAEFGRLCTF